MSTLRPNRTPSASGASYRRDQAASRCRRSTSGRLANFKANRRGYLELLVILLVLFVLSLFAEFIANDQPILARYKGETLSRCSVDYPEIEVRRLPRPVTDYHDPVIIDEINANGWMIWPPIRYSYDTINKDYPRRQRPDGLCLGYPAPTRHGRRARHSAKRRRTDGALRALGNTNWLGTRRPGP